jgi:hypothetical protein
VAASTTLGLPHGIPSDSILDLGKSLEVGEAGITGQAVQVANYDPFVRWINTEITRAEPSIMTQREQMTEAWKFYDGHQLSDEDLRILRNQRRPDTAINELQKFIKFAAGLERRTRQALLFAARTAENQQAQIAGELMTKQYEYFCETSSADDERSLAFESKLVSGLGFTEVGLSRKLDPQGGPKYIFCDAGEFWWPSCSKRNFGLDTPSPIKWLARETYMDVNEAISKWPDSAIFLRAAAGGVASEDQFPSFGRGAGRPINYVVPYIMTEPLNKGGGDSGKPGKVQILEWQHYDDEPGYYFFDPVQRDDAWLNDSDFRKLRTRYRLLFKQNITDYDRQEHRVFKRSFLLQRRILLEEPTTLPTRDAGYTWNVMTGSWDRHDKVWFGILRGFIAPQRYANAMLRQILEILGQSNKGGLMAESDAMTPAQKRDYEDTSARPGSINFVKPGAISGGKIKDKAVPVLPQGTMEVLSFCIDIMEKISGLSMSLLGADQSNTPGVSLRRRLTSGMVLLAAEFDSLSRFRKREGRLVLEFMRLMADDRLIRIGGPFDGQVIQLTKDPFTLQYDIVLDEYDADPSMRAYYTDQVLQIAPILVRTGNFIPDLLDYVNLPAQFRQKLKQGLQQSEQQKMQMAMQGISAGGRGKPRGLEEIKADTQLKQARAVEHLAKAKAMAAKPQQDNLRTVFDIAKSRHELGQRERELNIEMLGKLFDALKQSQGAGSDGSRR